MQFTPTNGTNAAHAAHAVARPSRRAARPRGLGRGPARLIGLALLAWLVAQWAALGHSVVHAPALVAVAQASAPAHADDAHHTAGSAVCHLLDQLLAGQATGGVPPVLAAPVAPCDRAGPVAAQPLPGAPRRPYQARGPPRA